MRSDLAARFRVRTQLYVLLYASSHTQFSKQCCNTPNHTKFVTDQLQPQTHRNPSGFSRAPLGRIRFSLSVVFDKKIAPPFWFVTRLPKKKRKTLDRSRDKDEGSRETEASRFSRAIAIRNHVLTQQGFKPQRNKNFTNHSNKNSVTIYFQCSNGLEWRLNFKGQKLFPGHRTAPSHIKKGNERHAVHVIREFSFPTRGDIDNRGSDVDVDHRLGANSIRGNPRPANDEGDSDVKLVQLSLSDRKRKLT